MDESVRQDPGKKVEGRSRYPYRAVDARLHAPYAGMVEAARKSVLDYLAALHGTIALQHRKCNVDA